MYAADPHLGGGIPCFYHLSHWSFGGNHHEGGMVPGYPIPSHAYYNGVAIGVTSIQTDVADLFREKIVGDSYEYDGKLLPLKKRTEVLRIKDGKGYKGHTVEFKSTHHGPIIKDPFGVLAVAFPRFSRNVIKTEDLALSWTGLFAEKSPYFLDLKQNGTSVPDFMQAYHSFGGPKLNLVMADLHGNIGYSSFGVFPNRRSGKSAPYIQDGSTKASDWIGTVPYESHPKILNPKKGYIVSANNRVSSEHVKYPVTTELPSPPRAERIDQLIREVLFEEKRKMTMEDMVRIQLDVVDIIAHDAIGFVRSIVDEHADEVLGAGGLLHRKGELQELIRMFDGWQGSFDKESVPATIYATWEMMMLESFLKDQIPDRLTRLHQFNSFISDSLVRDVVERVAVQPSFMSHLCASNVTVAGEIVLQR